jgi:hypothetical protein
MLTKLYGGHGPVYLNVSLSKVRGDVLDAAVEGLLLIALDEERGVHDHLVADRTVDPRGHRHVAQPLQEFGDVAAPIAAAAPSRSGGQYCIRAK